MKEKLGQKSVVKTGEKRIAEQKKDRLTFGGLSCS